MLSREFGVEVVRNIRKIVLLISFLCCVFGASADDLKFEVSSWVVKGENPLSERKATGILNAYLGAHVGLDRLTEATELLQLAIRDAGYTFYRVDLPPQTLEGGVVELSIFPFVLGNVSVAGAIHHDEENILNSLPGLVKGESPRAEKLSRQLGLGNLNPSRRAKLVFGSSTESGQLDARVDVSDRDPKRAYVWLSNTGDDDTGEYRMGVGYQNHNFLNRDNQLTLTYTTSPTESSKVSQYGLNVRTPHYRSAGMFDIFAIHSTSDTGRVAEFFDVRGGGDIYGVGYSTVIPKTGDASKVIRVGLSDKSFDSDINFLGTPIGVDVRSRPLSFFYRVDLEKDTFVSEFSLQAVKNLSSGANNDDATYAAARAGADADWSLFRAEAGAQTTFNNWTYGIKFEGQYADEPLISGEQFGAGGVHSVRGFRGREIAGDKGARLGLTITAPKLRSGLKFGWFFDAGTVERVSPLPDDSGKDSISGTGISLNWQWSRQIQMDAHFAHVLNAADQDVGSNTQEGDTFVHFNLSWFFQ